MGTKPGLFCSSPERPSLAGRQGRGVSGVCGLGRVGRDATGRVSCWKAEYDRALTQAPDPYTSEPADDGSFANKMCQSIRKHSSVATHSR